MRDVLRIGAGVAVGIGLLVLAGTGRDTPEQRASVADDPDDVEAPVLRSAPAAPGSEAPPPPPVPRPAPPALPPGRPGWQAGAHPPQEVVPSAVVRAARRRPEVRACPPAIPGSAGEVEGPEAAACSDPARAADEARPAVEIQWNAPGSTP